MKKRNRVLIILLATIATTLISNAKITPIMSAVPSEPKNADAMWIEPSIVNVTGLSIGYRFNVTVWTNVSVDCLAWQFQMLYDKSMVKAVAAGYTGTGGTRSEFFENSGAANLFALPPSLDVFYDATRNYVLHGEAWNPMIPNNPNATGCGSLSWIEFEVIAEPPAGQIITTEIDISTAHHPPTSKTYAQDGNQEEIPLDVHDCTYIFKSPTAITYNLTITTTVGGTTDPAPGIYSHPASTTVQVTAIQNPNYLFDHWELDTINVGSTNPHEVLMDEDHALKAVFVPVVVTGTKIFVDPPEIIDPTLVPCSSSFSINITIADVVDLKTLEFNLTYDSTVISWISMALKSVQNQTPTIKTMVDDENGFIWVKLQYPTAVSAIEPAPVLRIDFHVRSFGATPLDLNDTVLLNSLGQPIEHTAVDGFFATLIRDVAVTSITTSRDWAYQGWEVNVTVMVKNKGNVTETFELRAYYDDNLIGTKIVTNLTPGEDRNIIFEWDTTSVAEGNYTIKAVAETVPYELNTDDNTLIDGTVWIMILIHDIAITDVTCPNIAYKGWEVNVTVTVRNKGNFTETFTVQTFYDDILLGNVTVTDLPPETELIITFSWDTENVTACINYTISAEASLVPYEFNTTDNVFIDGKIKINYMGDVTGDGFVDVKDILAAADSYGSYPSSPRWNPIFDLDQNLVIDIKDLLIIALNYGKGCL